MSHSVSERPCAVCGSSHKAVLFRQRFAGATRGTLLDGYDVVLCADCGFGYADGLPEQQSFDEYYARMSKYEYAHQDGRQSDFDARRFPVAAAFVRSLVPDLKARILDIGCANGGFLRALREAGYSNLLGTDPSPACARTAERLYGLRVFTGAFSQLPAGIGMFDVVLLSAVLEHVRDLAAALALVRRLLQPHGLLYVEVPNVTRFASAPDAPFQEFSVEHINYFSVSSLRNLLAGSGFDLIESRQTQTTQGRDIVSHELKGMFRMVEEPAATNFQRDELTGPALLAYIAHSQDVERRIHEAIAPWVQSRRSIIVWGVGTHTQRLLATSALAQANIAAFVDSNPRYQGKLMKDLPILPPEALKARAEPILVSSRFFQDEIARQIRNELGLANELILLYRV